jgi:AGZA family xanthine/uracil permease-like MFS transporter
MVPAYASAAALLYVACVMARGLAEIDWNDMTEAAAAMVAAITMPLTYSIATGIGLGFITYALAKLIAGKFADAKPAVLVLGAPFRRQICDRLADGAINAHSWRARILLAR